MITGQPFDLIGVIHLLPLPGGPTPSPGFDAVVDRALRDAEALVRGGIRAAIVENLGDAPFPKGAALPHVVAGITAVATRIRQAQAEALELGINVLRNDVEGALGCALASGAAFVRANVLSGATWTDQGLIEGRAHDVLRYRRSLGLDPREASQGVLIAADVDVKHGSPAGGRALRDQAKDVAGRGGADILIVTGSGTGAACDPSDLEVVREVVGGQPVWVGSGVRLETASAWARRADGAIVGTWLHEEGDLRRPLDSERVQRLSDAMRGA